MRGGHTVGARASRSAVATGQYTDDPAEDRVNLMHRKGQEHVPSHASTQQQWQEQLQAQVQAQALDGGGHVLTQHTQAWSPYVAAATAFACKGVVDHSVKATTDTSSEDSRRSVDSHGSDSGHGPLLTKRLKIESYVARNRAPSFGGFSAAAAAVAAPNAQPTAHAKEAAAILATLKAQGGK